MKAIFENLLTGMKYLISQGLLEIIIILILEYLRFGVLSDISTKNNLLIENIQGIAWGISMKTVIFSIIYLPLFVVINFLLAWRKLRSTFAQSIVNTILNIALLFALFLLKRKDFMEILPLLTATLIASLIIIVVVNRRMVFQNS
jgi:hypothetical protein